MTGTGLRDDTTLGAIRLDWWAASDWNGARNTFGIPGRLRRNPHRCRMNDSNRCCRGSDHHSGDIGLSRLAAGEFRRLGHVHRRRDRRLCCSKTVELAHAVIVIGARRRCSDRRKRNRYQERGGQSGCELHSCDPFSNEDTWSGTRAAGPGSMPTEDRQPGLNAVPSGYSRVSLATTGRISPIGQPIILRGGVTRGSAITLPSNRLTHRAIVQPHSHRCI
jgi:hypothetical protein